MARGFAVFANGGFLVTPYFVDEVTDTSGRVVFKATPPLACPTCAQPVTDVQRIAASDEPAPPPGPVPPDRRAPVAITPANAFVMTDMMTDVIQRGTAQLAKTLNRRDIAGKTGTTSDRRDAWFVGFNADLSVATWIGFDQERTLGEREEGGRTALPMWVYFMDEALRGTAEHRQPEPPGVVRMWVSRDDGTPASAGGFGATFETFLEGHAPQGQGGVDGGLTDDVGAESVDASQGDESIF
jgi:penicillin-binding protein 1A